MAEKQLFGALLRRLQVRDEDLYELCCNAWQNPTFGEAPTAQVVGTRVAASDILSDIFGDAAPAAPVQETAATARDTAGAFATMVLDHWIERLRQFGGSTEVRTLFGLPAREVDQLCHELVQAAARCRLRENLEAELRGNTAYGNLARERQVWKQVSLAADAINAFVDWLDFDPRNKSRAERTLTQGGKAVSLFDPPPDIVGEPHIGEQEAPYDRLWYTDWLRALVANIMTNVDFDGQQNVNPEQNNRLRDILQVFKD